MAPIVVVAKPGLSRWNGWLIPVSALLCAGPAMLLFRLGSPSLASRAFLITLLAALGTQVVKRSPQGFIAVLIAISPVQQFLKNIELFHLPLFSAFVGLAFYLAWHHGTWRFLFKNTLLLLALTTALVYWWVSFLATGAYSSNLRSLELVLSATSVYVLSRHRSLLTAALTGFALSTFCYGVGTYGLSDRLGMATLGERVYGNAILMGTSAALIVLVSVADHGRWLWSARIPWIRAAVCAGALVCLVLSGSRGGWLTVAVGLVLIFSLVSEQRKHVWQVAVALGLVAAALIATGAAESVRYYFAKTVDTETTLAKRTTGRSEQWELMPRLLHEFPLGYGPGSGSASSVYYDHKALNWHSLYLHVGAETGFLGLGILACLLAAFLHQAAAHLRLCREVMPLLGIAGYMTIGVSVSAFDAVSGIYLGFSAMALELSCAYISRIGTLQCSYSSSAA